MSGVSFFCNSGSVSLAAATAKTALGLAAASNHRVHVKKITVSFLGIDGTAVPVTIELTRWSSDGTGTAGTIVKKNEGDNETPEASFKYNYSAEPTTPTVIESFALHPQGMMRETLPIEGPIPVIGGGFFGVELTAPAAVSAMVSLECEE